MRVYPTTKVTKAAARAGLSRMKVSAGYHNGRPTRKTTAVTAATSADRVREEFISIDAPPPALGRKRMIPSGNPMVPTKESRVAAATKAEPRPTSSGLASLVTTSQKMKPSTEFTAECNMR